MCVGLVNNCVYEYITTDSVGEHACPYLLCIVLQSVHHDTHTPHSSLAAARMASMRECLAVFAALSSPRPMHRTTAVGACLAPRPAQVLVKVILPSERSSSTVATCATRGASPVVCASKTGLVL
eukprot:3216294-Prymnesium_polylepis.2